MISETKEKKFLIIFAKEPCLGQVKTRLEPYFSKKEILNFYKACVLDTLLTVGQLNVDKKVVAYDSKKNPFFLKKYASRFILIKQNGSSLGERLYQAFLFAKKKGSTKTIIIGSDTPDLPRQYIDIAYQMLSKYDIVFGPSKDGGYYLIGLKKPLRKLFHKVQWSTSFVLRQSLEAASQLKRTSYLLKPWADIDYPWDIKNLRDRLKTKKSTASKVLRFLNGKKLK